MVHKPLQYGERTLFEIHLSSLLLFLKAIGRHLERGENRRDRAYRVSRCYNDDGSNDIHGIYRR